MKLLLDNRKLILHIWEGIEFGTYDGEEKWKVSEYLYMIDNGYTCVEITDVPLEVIPEKYFYIDNEFVINPNYVNPSEQERRITELETMLSALLD